MTNFLTDWEDGSTRFVDTDMNPPLQALGKVLGYHHNMIVHCDGDVTYNRSTGTLTWSGILRFIFLASNGNAIANYVSAGSQALTDNQFLYVDIVESDGNQITVGAATITTGSAANFSTSNRVILGYRNTTSDAFYPVALKNSMNAVGS